MKNKNVVLRLKDKSVVIGKIVGEEELANNNSNVITLFDPINIVQLINPMTGQPEVTMIPMDTIFADVKEEQNFVEIPSDFVLWKKDLSAFPNYEKNYLQAITKIETPNNKIIK
jgi:hypothetical protein